MLRAEGLADYRQVGKARLWLPATRMRALKRGIVRDVGGGHLKVVDLLGFEDS